MSSYNWHGTRLADVNLPPPECVYRTNRLARRDSNTGIDGSEYADSLQTLELKADIFIDLVKKSQRPALLTGAGLSSSSGIRDYASANGGTAHQKQQPLTYKFIFSCRPTAAHRVLAEMGRRRDIPGARDWCWTEQNHDGNELRAGWPFASNLIHGQWVDTPQIKREDNQVVPMSGNLRDDLFEHFLTLEKEMDMCISIGTSHSGLNVDSLVETAGVRHKEGKGLGLIMCTIQKTQYDDLVGLRVFAKTDLFFMIVAKKLGYKIDFETDYNSATLKPIKYKPEQRSKVMVGLCRDPYFAPAIHNPEASGPADTPFCPTTAVAFAASNTDTVTPSFHAAATVLTTVSNRDASVEKTTARARAPATNVSMEDNRFSITVGNRHRETNKGGHNCTHEWEMFVRAPEKGIVQSVTFDLHPTFKPQQVTVKEGVVNNKTGSEEFSCKRLGWGTFQVDVEIHFCKGMTLTTQHELSFLAPETSAVHFPSLGDSFSSLARIA